MSKLAALAGSNGGMIASVAVVAAVAVSAGVYITSQNAGTEPPVPVVEAAQVPEAAPAPAPEVVAAPAPDVAAPQPPSIDEVRLEPDGLTIIAGRAAPGSEVSVLLDGAKNTSVTTDQGGAFAAITILPDSAKARVLTVVARVGADEIASVDEVILAPQTKPVVAAEAPEAVAEPESEPEAEVVAEVPATESTPEEVAQAEVEPALVEEDVAAVDEPPVAEAEPEATAPEAVAPAEEAAPIDALVAQAEEAPAPAVEEAAPVIADAPAAESAEPASDDVAALPDVASEVEAVAPVAEEPAPVVAEVETEAPAEPTPEPQVTVLRSTADGVEVLNTTPPEALENIEIDTISYSETGDVQLAGRAQGEAEVVRVYVNNRPIADLDVDETGKWRGDLPQIDTGVYTLRVDELNKAGDVTSRVETPFRREDPEVLAQIDDPESPANQITVQTGNTLWGIARDRYGEGRLFVEVFEANRDRIRNADLIFPGQVFALPE
ncbi:MAG: peptigoglycan-binding protein LysM [Pseudomonadota bacterium]